MIFSEVWLAHVEKEEFAASVCERLIGIRKIMMNLILKSTLWWHEMKSESLIERKSESCNKHKLIYHSRRTEKGKQMWPKFSDESCRKKNWYFHRGNCSINETLQSSVNLDLRENRINEHQTAIFVSFTLREKSHCSIFIILLSFCDAQSAPSFLCNFSLSNCADLLVI